MEYAPALTFGNADDVKRPYIRSLRAVQASLKRMANARVINRAMLLSTNYARVVDRNGIVQRRCLASRPRAGCDKFKAVQD